MVAEIPRANLVMETKMTNFNVNFTNAWWLLLLIPAVVLTLISYFRVNKRYRCTRNRIVSVSLHLVIMFLAIALLAGLTFDYYVPNTENEVIVLVDSSFTTEDAEDDADDFVKTVIDNCDSMFKLGIVKFGYDQVYAVELTNKLDKAYSNYLSADEPDTTATDIASALKYAASLFTNTTGARIVLLSDGLETDDEALDVIKAIHAQGISVDTVYFSEETDEDKQEVQILHATQSTDKVEINTPFNMEVTIESSYAGPATITPYDNNIAGSPVDIQLEEDGTTTVSIPYSFAWGGMHVVSFDIAAQGDVLTQNNTYHTHIYLETFTEILVIESIDDESSSLVELLGEELNVKVVNVEDPNAMPTTVEQLRAYDEVILVNVANSDMPVGFDRILQQYVHTYGGGLFTICGNTKNSTEDDWTANAYTRKDMYKTLYQDMLPVEIIEYTAPVGVIVVVDTSGSMLGGTFESSPLYWALKGATACIDALSERDFMGVMTLSDSYTEELILTPRTQRDKILASIAELEEAAIDGTLPSGGTMYSPALERAGKALAARSDIEKKHIILVSDAQPAASDAEFYRFWAQENAKNGVSMSVVGINASSDGKGEMIDLLVNYAGCKETNYHDINKDNMGELPTIMRKDLEVPEIKSVNYEQFYPQITTQNAVTNGILSADIPALYGYYGVKIKDNATVVLSGKYTPLYSQWTYGTGRVGTFACDLNGTWSADFIASEIGARIVNNIVYALFPTENIRPKDVEANITGDNYTTNLSIFTTLGDTEKIKVTVTSPKGEEQVIVANKETGYSRLSFAVKENGLHTILIQKLNENDELIASTTLYKTLAYSLEYDAFADKKGAEALLATLAERSDGYVLSDPLEVFENAVEFLHIIIDPRVLFAILIIVFFLVDIAARKFKWKWPHEIIRERKQKQLMGK